MAWVEQTGVGSWRVRHIDDEGRVRSISGFMSGSEARE
jgi:hypothetical protein